MRSRTINNGQSRYFILDEYKTESRTKPDILAMRETDGHVVIAHGWDEARGEWDYGNYYGDSSEALQKAVSDFGEIKDAYTELESSGAFETYDDDFIDPRDLKQAIDFDWDPEQMAANMEYQYDLAAEEQAAREKESHEGYRDSGPKAWIEEDMSTRLSSMKEDGEYKTPSLSEADALSEQYDKLVQQVLESEEYVDSLKADLEEYDIDDSEHEAILYELFNSADVQLEDALAQKEAFLKEHPGFDVQGRGKQETGEMENAQGEGSITGRTQTELMKDMQALGYEFDKEDFFLMFNDTETGKRVGYDGWESVQLFVGDIQHMACSYSTEELKARQAGDFEMIAYRDYSDDVIDKALFLKEKIGQEKIADLSLEEKKEAFRSMPYKEQFKTVLEIEMPEIEGDTQLQETLYESYMAGPQDSFLNARLRQEFEKSMKDLNVEKIKQKGLEVE